MTVIRNNSISGINSITAQSGALNFYDSTGNTLSIGADVTGGVTVATGATISGSTNTIVASTNGSERVRVHTSGKVGINTDDFARDYRLSIADSSSVGTIAGILINDTDGKEFSIRSSSNGLRFRDVTSGNDRLVIDTNGNLVFPTSGQGIDFSATTDGGGTTNSELLDDYEEGTWTPSLGGTSTNPTVNHTSQIGFYTKIGNFVYVSCLISSNTASGGSGSLTVDGLPFAISQTTGSGGSPSFTGYDAPTSSSQAAINCSSETWNGNTRIFAFLFSYDNSTWINGNVSGLPAASTFSYRVCFGYQTT